jgi:hypothetical protein
MSDPAGQAALRYAETGVTWLALVQARAADDDTDAATVIDGLDRDQLAHLAHVGADIAACWLANYVETLGHPAEQAGPAVIDNLRRMLLHVIATGGTCTCDHCDGLRRIQAPRDAGTPPARPSEA